MKPLILAASISIVWASVAGEAIAACAASPPNVTRVSTVADLNTLLTGNTVCVPPVAIPNMKWQELHQSGGALVDYKRGPGHATDPSETVGTWSVTSVGTRSAVVTYNYGAGGSFTYSVYKNDPTGATYSFCSANPEIVARIKPGGGPC